MAINIINKRPLNPIYQGECSCCGCLFEFEDGDANMSNDSQIEGFSYNVTCPFCGRNVLIRYSVIKAIYGGIKKI